MPAGVGPTNWWIGHFNNDLSPTMSQTPRFQICPQCLIGDGQAQTQFLRLRWQCAAMTICQEHSMPLQEEMRELSPGQLAHL